MNTSILYVILAIGIAFGITWLVSYLRRKDLLKQEDLLFAAKILDLSVKIINELELQREEEIRRISLVVQDSLEYAISIFNSEIDVIENAYEYALDLCLALDIELTDNRKEIIRELITITFNNHYIDFVEV